MLDHASMVLPACVAHERAGTTTNLEGRVTRLGQKLVAPGLAWPDTDIAAELARGARRHRARRDRRRRHRRDRGGVRHSLGHHAPARSPAADDGVVVGRAGAARAARAARPRRVPGRAVAEPRRPAGARRVGRAPRADRLEGRRGRGGRATTPTAFDAPPHDAYSLRLVAARRLYDRGAAIEASPSLHALVGTASVAVNPYDLDRIGVHGRRGRAAALLARGRCAPLRRRRGRHRRAPSSSASTSTPLAAPSGWCPG